MISPRPMICREIIVWFKLRRQGHNHPRGSFSVIHRFCIFITLPTSDKFKLPRVIFTITGCGPTADNSPDYYTLTNLFRQVLTFGFFNGLLIFNCRLTSDRFIVYIVESDRARRNAISRLHSREVVHRTSSSTFRNCCGTAKRSKGCAHMRSFVHLVKNFNTKSKNV